MKDEARSLGEHLGRFLDAGCVDQVVAAVGDHCFYALLRIIPMKLQGHAATAKLNGLIVATHAAGKPHRAGRNRECIAVPVERRDLPRIPRKNRMAGRLVGEFDREPADFLLPIGRDPSAEHRRDQLCA